MKPLIPPTIIVRIEKGEADKTEFRFTDSFQIGRVGWVERFSCRGLLVAYS